MAGGRLQSTPSHYRQVAAVGCNQEPSPATVASCCLALLRLLDDRRIFAAQCSVEHALVVKGGIVRSQVAVLQLQGRTRTYQFEWQVSSTNRKRACRRGWRRALSSRCASAAQRVQHKRSALWRFSDADTLCQLGTVHTLRAEQCSISG